MPTGTPFILGKGNTANNNTSLSATTSPQESGIEALNVLGTGAAAGSVLALGLDAASLFGTGLRVQGTTGIKAKGTDTVGIFGECIQQGDKKGIVGVAGRINRGGYGVFGSASGPFPDAAVHGRGADGIGVDGLSFRNVGVRGLSQATDGNGIGIFGDGKAAHGVVGRTDVPLVVTSTPPFFKLLYAGLFFGNVFVNGDFTITGSKSAAVKHSDGSLRRLYCMESPESWFEDFGSGRLVRGRASIKLDKTFRALVRTGNYHVFLSPEGDSKGLYVTRKTSAGFMVHEQQKGASSIKFSYRIVAHRKDVRSERFEKVVIPELPQGLNRIHPEPTVPADKPASAFARRLKGLARRRRAARAR